jgi:hypothetical protein
MAAFKAIFQSAFFSGVIYLGCIAIIAAISQLIVRVDSNAYAHTANIVFVIIAPLFFLSLIPVYPGRRWATLSDERDQQQLALLERRTGCPKFLEVLLSYILVPLASVFTVILLVYIILNIGGRFWTNNLLEPLLIAYSLIVIVITLLISQLENKTAVLFRLIFPKVLIPITLFQVVASVLLMTNTGVTSSRYFIILYGVFAVLSGCVLGFMPVHKNGLIAVLLIAFSAISLIPPVDAFTVSRNSQISSLESILRKDGMLSDHTVIPNDKIADEDKLRILTSIQYLAAADELSYIKWLPVGFNSYDDTIFFKTFGFHLYVPANPELRYVNVYFDMAEPIPITGYDVFKQLSIPNPGQLVSHTTININGKACTIIMQKEKDAYAIDILDGEGNMLCRFNTNEIFSRYAAYTEAKSMLTLEEASFMTENENLVLKIIVTNAGFSMDPDITDQSAQLLIFMKIK